MSRLRPPADRFFLAAWARPRLGEAAGDPGAPPPAPARSGPPPAPGAADPMTAVAPEEPSDGWATPHAPRPGRRVSARFALALRDRVRGAWTFLPFSRSAIIVAAVITAAGRPAAPRREEREMSTFDSLRVSVVQAGAVPFDRDATIEKVCALTAEAAARGAGLVLFPEAYVGGYPWGLAFGTAVGGRSEAGRRTWERYWASAVDVPGPDVDRLRDAARDAGVYLCVGVVERDSTFSGGTLFCTLLYLGPGGELLGKHRKLKPTAAERLIWGEGDGSTLTTVETPYGTVGGLICWENYMPLARMSMYAKGVDIYLAPTADARERWQSTLQHIALEGRCFVLGCNQYVHRGMYPDDLEIAEELEAWPETLSAGGSAIYGPLGELLAGPLWNEEGMLVSDLDLTAIPRSKFDFDVTGHYARPDVFKLTVDEAARPPVG